MYLHGVPHSCQHCRDALLPRTLTSTHTHFCQQWHATFLLQTLKCTHMASHILVNTSITHSCHELSHVLTHILVNTGITNSCHWVSRVLTCCRTFLSILASHILVTHSHMESKKVRDTVIDKCREGERDRVMQCVAVCWRNVRFKITHHLPINKIIKKTIHIWKFCQCFEMTRYTTFCPPDGSWYAATHCNTPHHAAPHCNTLQHTPDGSWCASLTRAISNGGSAVYICVCVCMCAYVCVREGFCVYVYMCIYLHIIIHVFQQRYQQRRIYNQIVVLLQTMIVIGNPLIEVQVRSGSFTPWHRGMISKWRARAVWRYEWFKINSECLLSLCDGVCCFPVHCLCPASNVIYIYTYIFIYIYIYVHVHKYIYTFVYIYALPLSCLSCVLWLTLPSSHIIQSHAQHMLSIACLKRLLEREPQSEAAVSFSSENSSEEQPFDGQLAQLTFRKITRKW